MSCTTNSKCSIFQVSIPNKNFNSQTGDDTHYTIVENEIVCEKNCSVNGESNKFRRLDTQSIKNTEDSSPREGWVNLEDVRKPEGFGTVSYEGIDYETWLERRGYKICFQKFDVKKNFGKYNIFQKVNNQQITFSS